MERWVTMLKNVVSGLVIVVLGLFSLGVAGFNLSRSDAQEAERTLANLLHDVYENDLLIAIRFVSPIAGETEYWIIPEEVSIGDSTMLRTFYEIGTDYFCVQEAAQGATEVKCIPFSNIAEVTYTRTD